MKNKAFLNRRVLLAVLIMITTIFSGCNMGSQVSTDRLEQEIEENTSNSETVGDESETKSESDTEKEIDTEFEIEKETETEAKETESSDTSTTESPSDGNASSSNSTSGSSNSSAGNNSEGTSGKTDVSDIVLADGERIMYAISAVYVRSYKSTDSEILGTLSAGEAVVVVEKSYSGWEKIKYGNGYGYVASKFLEGDEEDSEEVVVDDKYQNDFEEVSKLAQEIVSKVITPSMSEFEKAMVIHDWLICNVVYELNGYLSGTIPYECYTAYGALKNGVAVCDGYTKAFNLLAKEVGLESIRVTGEADGGFGRGGHAWNKVKIDGVWYNVDVTWDDAVTDFEEDKDNLFTYGYEYFLLSDEDLSKDHFPDYETVECLVTYDRIALYKYAFGKIDYGENIAFAVTAEEVVNAINKFGKANMSDIEIWFYDPADEGFSIVMDAAEDAKYPNTGNATGTGNTKGMMQCYLTIVTEEVLSKAGVFTDKDDYAEIINSKFDTGVTSFYLIYDTCDGNRFTRGFETTFINYEFDFEWLPAYDGGKLYLYKFTLIGPKE